MGSAGLFALLVVILADTALASSSFRMVMRELPLAEVGGGGYVGTNLGVEAHLQDHTH